MPRFRALTGIVAIFVVAGLAWLKQAPIGLVLPVDPNTSSVSIISMAKPGDATLSIAVVVVYHAPNVEELLSFFESVRCKEVRASLPHCRAGLDNSFNAFVVIRDSDEEIAIPSPSYVGNGGYVPRGQFANISHNNMTYGVGGLVKLVDTPGLNSEVRSKFQPGCFLGETDGVVRRIQSRASVSGSFLGVVDGHSEQQKRKTAYGDLPPSSFNKHLSRYCHTLLGGEVTAGNIIRLVLGFAVAFGGGGGLLWLGSDRAIGPNINASRRLCGIFLLGIGLALFYCGLGFVFSSSLDGWSALYRGLLLPF